MIPYLGGTSQGNTSPRQRRILLGEWTDKPSHGKRPPEKCLLVEAGDFQRGSFSRTVAHELGHILGFESDVGTGLVYWAMLDLFRYSAAGVHTVSATTAGYFSADGGRTNLDWYATSSDLGDWAASAGNDANTAYAHPGVVNAFTAADITQMNVLGYALA